MHRWLASLAIVSSLFLPALADEMPKPGSTQTFMIPADSPPSFDGHRENTFATIHAVARFYSVLIRANPENPADTTQFVCDVCTEIPKPSDDGKTYTFRIRDDHALFVDGMLICARQLMNGSTIR
jgi:peptide/nickel transport system substrate-binding protein